MRKDQKWNTSGAADGGGAASVASVAVEGRGTNMEKFAPAENIIIPLNLHKYL